MDYHRAYCQELRQVWYGLTAACLYLVAGFLFWMVGLGEALLEETSNVYLVIGLVCFVWAVIIFAISVCRLQQLFDQDTKRSRRFIRELQRLE